MTVLGAESSEVGRTAQITPLVSNIAARGPGALKGRPRPPGSGRKPGTKNRRSILGSEYLAAINPKAKRRLRQIIEGKDDELALKAATLVLAYSFGRPIEAREISGPNGAPIQTRDVDDREFARLVAFTLTMGERQPALVEVPVVSA